MGRLWLYLSLGDSVRIYLNHAFVRYGRSFERGTTERGTDTTPSTITAVRFMTCALHHSRPKLVNRFMTCALHHSRPKVRVHVKAKHTCTQAHMLFITSPSGFSLHKNERHNALTFLILKLLVGIFSPNWSIFSWIFHRPRQLGAPGSDSNMLGSSAGIATSNAAQNTRSNAITCRRMYMISINSSFASPPRYCAALLTRGKRNEIKGNTLAPQKADSHRNDIMLDKNIVLFFRIDAQPESFYGVPEALYGPSHVANRHFPFDFTDFGLAFCASDLVNLLR